MTPTQEILLWLIFAAALRIDAKVNPSKSHWGRLLNSAGALVASVVAVIHIICLFPHA